jgi:hypothetical protein
LQRHRVIERLFRAGRDARIPVAVGVEIGAGDRQGRPGAGVRGVERHGLLQLGDAGAQCGGIGARDGHHLSSAQPGAIRLLVLRRPGLEQALFVGRRRDAEGAADAGGELRRNAGQCAVLDRRILLP